MKHNRVRLLVDDAGRMTLVDVHGYEIITSKLSVEVPVAVDQGGDPIVTVEIPGVRIERSDPHRECGVSYVHGPNETTRCGEAWYCPEHQ